MSRLHQNLQLHVFDSAYWVVADGPAPEALVIDRASGALSRSDARQLPSRAEHTLSISAVFGVITLKESAYLIVVTKRHLVARVLATAIYAARDFAVYPISRNPASDLLRNPEEAYLLGLLKTHLDAAPLYFTYGEYDVTTRLQNQPAGDRRPMWERADDRFFWNRYLQSRAIEASTARPDQDLSAFIVPFVFGFLEFTPSVINGRNLVFGVISRRSRFRAGTRYFSRGIDLEGNVSNFNETEQILLLDSQSASPSLSAPVRGDVRFSYVQTRGSVPVYWAEINNLRYKPDLKIMDLSSTAESLRRHFDQQISHYGDQYLVNLVNRSGYEKPVKEAYERAVEAIGSSRVHYTYFDFHHECKGLRFDRVSVLIDSLHDELQEQGFFYEDRSAEKTAAPIKQSSVVRTNCMDCLDRTNVVQSALGKWVLNNQLRLCGVLSVKESIDDHPGFLSLFRNVWADNADTVSRAYSGTGALKTDYTRTGKRSTEGAVQDGINSAVRYIKNNFLDGPRQDAYDLVTGAWVPRNPKMTAWTDDRPLLTRMAPMLLSFVFTVVLLSLSFPELVTAYMYASRRLVLAGAIMTAGILLYIVNNGVDYVAWPRLNRLDDVISYSGKGVESGRRGRPVRLVNVESAARSPTATAMLKESVLPSGTSNDLEKKRVD